MIIALLRWHSLDLVLEILGVGRLLLLVAFGDNLVELCVLLVREQFIGKQRLMHNPIEHPRPEHPRKILLVRLRALARENTNELTAPIIFLNGLVKNVSEFDEAAFS